MGRTHPIKVCTLKVMSFGFLMAFATNALAEIFDYSQHIYDVDAAACQTQALELASRISRATGGTTQAAYCAPLTGGGFDARALTEVRAIPEIELAVFGFRVIRYEYPGRTGPQNKGYSVISDEGTYWKVTDCLAALPAYIDHFRDHTGLDPMSGQCALMAGGRYVPHVDGLGVGRKHLYETSISIGSGQSSEAIGLDVANYLRTLGATPTNAARPSSFVQIKYFASEERSLTAFDFSSKNTFRSEPECLAAVNATRPILSKHSELKVVSLQCGGSRWPDETKLSGMIAIFDLTASGQESPGLSVYTFGQFQNYAECAAQQPATPDSYCAADIDDARHFHGYSLNVIR